MRIVVITSSLLKMLCNEVSRVTRPVTITVDPCQTLYTLTCGLKLTARGSTHSVSSSRKAEKKLFGQDKISVKRLNANVTGDGSRVPQLVDGDLT